MVTFCAAAKSDWVLQDTMEPLSEMTERIKSQYVSLTGDWSSGDGAFVHACFLSFRQWSWSVGGTETCNDTDDTRAVVSSRCQHLRIWNFYISLLEDSRKWQHQFYSFPSLHDWLFFSVSKHQRCLDPTVTLHYFHWPTPQPDMHTKIALRLQSSSHLGDTNGMIDTNVSRANCTADLRRSDGASYPSNHLSCWQELLWGFFLFMNGSSYSSKQHVSVFHMLSGCHADPSGRISTGVFLLWLFKRRHQGQGVRLIQLRGQQARVISVLPSQGDGKRGAEADSGQKHVQLHFEESWLVIATSRLHCMYLLVTLLFESWTHECFKDFNPV